MHSIAPIYRAIRRELCQKASVSGGLLRTKSINVVYSPLGCTGFCERRMCTTATRASVLAGDADARAQSLALLTEVLDTSTVWDTSLLEASVAAAIVLDEAAALDRIITMARTQGVDVSMNVLRKHLFTAERAKSKQCIATLRLMMSLTDNFAQTTDGERSVEKGPPSETSPAIAKLHDLLGASDSVAAPHQFVQAVDFLLSDAMRGARKSLKQRKRIIDALAQHGNTRWLLDAAYRTRDRLLSGLASTREAKLKGVVTESEKAESSALCNILLHAFALTNNFGGAAITWEIIKDFQLAPDIAAVNAWFNVLLQASKYAEVNAISERMLTMPGLQPDADTLRHIITAKSATESFAAAQKAWDELTVDIPPKRKRVIPTVGTYNALLTAAADHGMYRQALHILDRMMRTGVAPTVDSFNAVMLACVFADRPHVAFSLYDEMKRIEVKPTEQTFYALATVAAEHAATDLSKEVLVEMDAAGLPPSPRVYAAIIHSAANSGDMHTAYDALQDYRIAAAVSKELRQPEAYLAVLNTACAAVDASTPPKRSSSPQRRSPLHIISDIAQQLREDGVDQTAEVFAALIRAYIIARDFMAAINVLQHAIENQAANATPNMMLTPEMFIPILRCSGVLAGVDGFSSAVEMLRQQLAAGLKPSINLFNAVAAAAADVGQAEYALGVLDAFEAAGLSPTEASFQHVLRATVKANAPDIASTVIERMGKYGISPSAELMKIVAEATHRTADLSKADPPSVMLSDFPNLTPQGKSFGRRRRRRGLDAPAALPDDIHNDEMADETNAAEDELEMLGDVMKSPGAPKSFKDKPFQGGFALFPSVSDNPVQRIRAGSVTVPVPRGMRAKSEAEVMSKKLAGISPHANADDAEDDSSGIAALQEEIRSTRKSVRLVGAGGRVITAESEAAAMRMIETAMDDVKRAAGITSTPSFPPKAMQDDSEDADAPPALDGSVSLLGDGEDDVSATKKFARAYAKRMSGETTESKTVTAKPKPKKRSKSADVLEDTPRETRKHGALFGEDPDNTMIVTAQNSSAVDYSTYTFRQLEDEFKKRGISRSKRFTKADLAARLSAYDRLQLHDDKQWEKLTASELTLKLKAMNKRVVGGAAAKNWAASSADETQRLSLLAQYKAAILEQALPPTDS